ncbi:epoxide hydrolase N-terminal domain-containing protein [Sphingobium sp. CFD-2]|uniref:epoxide hydrolase N-terminal domain-containing protein n=1 Tax=Sphingobium sp. CFD-2 TaxID=2878542 RepID=UPI00214CE1A4|nr:epoxide hydrolase N-terminal domain-containing protein [Sphingobium sp. CFD-2]
MSIPPFKFRATDAALADLKCRIAASKWRSQKLVPDASQGVKLATMRKLATYWEKEQDWCKGEAHDDVLDNVTLYWLTGTAVSSARLYWESKLPFFAPKGVKILMGVSAFPDANYIAPQSWAEQAYPKLVHYNRLPKSGHFAA